MSRIVKQSTPGTTSIATTGNTDEYLIAAATGTLKSALFSSLAALAAHDTNFVTFSITNLGQAGAGSTAMLAATAANTTKITGGTALSANTKRALTLNGTAANLAVVDFHPWPSRRADVDKPDELRIDIDPQPGTTFADAKKVAAVVRETLAEMGWTGWPKTSGNRGIHVAVRIEPNWEFPVVRRCALAFAREIERRSELVTTAWWKEERGERVFIDYNQNARDRTIASAYSVRGRPDATVSAPVSWDELPDVETEDFTLASMPDRFAKLGDVQAGIDDAVCDLNVLLEWVEREESAGVGEAPYPPQFPKMPGEPKRVQPSRAKKPAK